MYSFASLRSALPLLARPPALRPAIASAPLLHRRTAANYPGLKPGSQTLSHAAENIKEEAANTGKDLARAIAGVNVAKDGFVSSSRARLAF